MPIRPENKARYPKNWKEIRKAILERAGHQCEFCGLDNYVCGYRDENKDFVPTTDIQSAYQAGKMGFKLINVVLTIAHMDHTPENNDPANLKALCQQCHNRYDMKFRVENRKKNKLTPKSEASGE